jgi:non-ribosomal peptide synthetase-like protein
MGLFLLLRWVDVFVLTLITTVGLDLTDRYGALPVAASMVLDALFVTAVGVLVERAATGFRPMSPQQCSIYDPYFWWHERYWKLVGQPAFFNGTPFKNLIWRVLGVRIGRRVFDDGATIPERTLVAIGDGCTLNAGIAIQAHSQEDGGFKSDRITIGAGVTLGVGSWVHYGVTMGDGTELGPDAFLMKGSEVLPGEHWGGNPAQELRDDELPTGLPASAPASDDAPHDDAPAGRSHDTMEEFMEVFGEDALPDARHEADPPPRRAGRHRARQRHQAATR